MGKVDPLKEVFFFKYGQVAAFDRSGKQVPRWQMNAVHRVMLQMAAAGFLADDTVVNVEWGERGMTWKDYREEKADWLDESVEEDFGDSRS